MIEIKELTDKEIESIKTEFPQSTPKRFAILETTHVRTYTMAYCNTREQAEIDVKQWAAREDLQDKISNFQDEMVDEFSSILDEDEIRKMIKES